MAGYQFAHMATHSRKGNKRYTSVLDVTAEAARLRDACPHVSNPQPPNILFGCSPEKIPDIIEGRIERAKHINQGKGIRGIRCDTHVLESQVHSHPAYTQEPPPGSQTDSRWLGDRECAADYSHWRRLTVAFIMWDAERRGLKVLSIVEHLDEPHPHIHGYLAPNSTRHDAKTCHPGHLAAGALKASGDSAKEIQIAFLASMRQWQDEYYERVGIPCGLARIGPHLGRLDRRGWHQEQQANERRANANRFVAEAEADSDFADQVRAATEKRTDAAVEKANEANARAAHAEARLLEAQSRAAASDRSARECDGRVRQANHDLARIEQEQAKAEDALARVQAQSEAAERQRQITDATIVLSLSNATREEELIRRRASAEAADAERQKANAAEAAAAATALERGVTAQQHAIEARLRDHQVREAQHALLLRASVDEDLRIRANVLTGRGFTMNKDAMKPTERDAYLASWSEPLKALALQIAEMFSRVREALRRQSVVERQEHELATARDDHTQSVTLHNIQVRDLEQRRVELLRDRSFYKAAFKTAEFFNRAFLNVPAAERSLAARKAIHAASELVASAQQLGPADQPATLTKSDDRSNTRGR